MNHFHLSNHQRETLQVFYHVINSYYSKGNPTYTTLMGYTLDLNDTLKVIFNIMQKEWYDNYEQELLNNVRSMYISLTHNVS